MAYYLLQSLKMLLKDTVLTTGEKESRLLETREYLHSEVRRRKDQAECLESCKVSNHGATLGLYNIESFRAINLVLSGNQLEFMENLHLL